MCILCSSLVEYFMQITEKGWRGRQSLINVGWKGPFSFLWEILIQRYEGPGSLWKLKSVIKSDSRELHFAPLKIKLRMRLSNLKHQRRKKLLWIQGYVIKMSSGFRQLQTHRDHYKAGGWACLLDKHQLGITTTRGLITSWLYAKDSCLHPGSLSKLDVCEP